MQVVSLQDQCIRCVTAHLVEFSAEHMSKVPYRLRYGLLRSLSLADVWKLENVLAEQVGVDVTRVWEQFMRDHRVSSTGLDFVHGYHEEPPQGKATFTKSLSDREICFQRLWNDLQVLKQKRDPTSVPSIQRLLFSLSYDPLDRDFSELVPEELKLDSIAGEVLARSVVRLFIVAAIQVASRARPMFLRHCSIMDYLKPKRRLLEQRKTQAIVKQLLSNVTAINTPSEEIGEEWFDLLLSNGKPTLKLCVRYDLFQYVVIVVRKCAEKKKIDELIIRLRDDVLPVLELSSFTIEMTSHFPHLQLLEINSLHKPQVSILSAIPAKFAPSLQRFMENPHFSCLRLSGVVTTAVARSLVLTFLSTPCASKQRLHLANMCTDRNALDSKDQSLPERNDYYSHKHLSLDSVRMTHAKEFNMHIYQENSDVIEQYYFPNTENHHSKNGTLTSWLLRLRNLKIGSLEIYDYHSNYFHGTVVPSTARIDVLKMFMVITSEEKCIWTDPLFDTIIVHPTLQKCLLDLRILKLSSSRNNYYLKALSDVLLQRASSGNLSILSITVNKNHETSAVEQVQQAVSSSLPRLVFDVETGIHVQERHL